MALRQPLRSGRRCRSGSCRPRRAARQELREAGLVDRWFFIRYGDPGRHLRVRLHGPPRELLSEVLPALHEATAPALDGGLLYRISLDTYEREVERYGGLEGVELMEQVAAADSDAVIEILQRPLDAIGRRHLAVASLAAFYADTGLSLERRHACCVCLRTNWMPSGASPGALLGPGSAPSARPSRRCSPRSTGPTPGTASLRCASAQTRWWRSWPVSARSMLRASLSRRLRTSCARSHT